MMFFISQPMRGRDYIDIVEERTAIRNILLKHGHGCKRLNYVEHLTFEPVYSLGHSIKDISTCDAVVFADGWEDARGCKIEWLVCKWYDIPRYYVDLDEGRLYHA